jgi:D-alanyl-lipoteichoic acid acyltransferase DltB (MBOAT superfamily)
MLIGGLWHGASWTFVVWGGLHGAYLIGERVLDRVLPAGAWRRTRTARAAAMVVTFALVCVAWVFFRATSFDDAFAIVRTLFGIDTGYRVSPLVDYKLVLAGFVPLIALQWMTRELTIEEVVARTPWFVRAIALGLMVTALVLMQGQDRAFIYFQF